MIFVYLILSLLGDIVVCIEDDVLIGLYFVGQKYFLLLVIVCEVDVFVILFIVCQVVEEIVEYFIGVCDMFLVLIYLCGIVFQ